MLSTGGAQSGHRWRIDCTPSRSRAECIWCMINGIPLCSIYAWKETCRLRMALRCRLSHRSRQPQRTFQANPRDAVKNNSCRPAIVCLFDLPALTADDGQTLQKKTHLCRHSFFCSAVTQREPCLLSQSDAKMFISVRHKQQNPRRWCQDFTGTTRSGRAAAFLFTLAILDIIHFESWARYIQVRMNLDQAVSPLRRKCAANPCCINFFVLLKSFCDVSQVCAEFSRQIFFSRKLFSSS